MKPRPRRSRDAEMKGLGKIAAVFMTAIALSGCDYDSDLNLLETTMKWNQVGESRDQWLEQRSTLRNEWDKVALIFGFADDYDGCTDIANGMAAKFPLSRYRCVPAN